MYVRGRSPLRLEYHTPVPEHWVTNPLLRRYNPRGILEVPLYGYDENREVRISADSDGENILEYAVKAKGPGGKLPPEILTESSVDSSVCSYGLTMPHTCNKLLMIGRGSNDHVGRLARRLYVNSEQKMVVQFVKLVKSDTNKYTEEIINDLPPVAVNKSDLAIVPEKADEHKVAIAAIRPLQDRTYTEYMARYGVDVSELLVTPEDMELLMNT